MKKTTFIFSLLLILPIMLMASSHNYISEEEFLVALGDAEMSMEDYENCDNMNFDISQEGLGDKCKLNKCNDRTGRNFEWSTKTTLVFSQAINAFGTTIYDSGDQGPVTITLMTDDGKTYEVYMRGEHDQEECNVRFFGVISDMKFTTAVFRSDNPKDLYMWDNTYHANLQFAESVPTLGQWGLVTFSLLSFIFGVVALRKPNLVHTLY